MLIRHFISVNIILILTIAAGVSAYAEAPAHIIEGEDEETIAGLVKAISGDFAEPESSPEVEGVLDEICLLGVLDYMTDIYDSADFYESGYWGKDGNTFHSEVYTGTLPAYSDDDFVRPVVGGRLTSVYGYRESYHRMHKGVDISLNEGDVVRASLPGVVGRIGYERGGYGHFVVLVHSDGVETRYAHLSRVTASLGQRVYAGQEIALGGNTGNSTGPHLHFEVRKNGRAIDPLLLFNF